ncbi:PQQ-binding-like beta-propeller repeat protein [Nordella sp. HKS 07]|uniref:pyrroloquinoline quinone-dependent dehydrogenase n=1 Tax=Nordella sp. HKS 07 TaxID=2712222 RepID=UPI0013E1AD78|nr:PQQ-binding-like beta-propeller repeat protein [Nordella sp. HKS 07]QIG47218.1 PQQ-binding-like beta-propeller repeat protein [Nordella sp. HKS 07]
MTKTKKILLIGGALVVIGAVTGGALYLLYPVQVEIAGGLVRNYIVSSTPPGTTTTELNAAYKAAEAAAAPPAVDAPSASAAGDWPSYNRTVASDRYSPLSEINAKNAGKLKVLCTYDVGEFAAFESGLIMVENALIGTTVYDIFSIDPNTCKENWRTHEDYNRSILPANRGAAYWDGMLFRGTQDGRVLAYDFKTGKRIWETTIGDAKLNEVVSSAPIAWDGLVFVGNAGGDFKGAKGRMYALDAKTGKIVWEFFLVPKTEGDTVRGPQGKSPLDTATWKNATGIPISGGGTWTSYTLDTTTGLLYVPGGNPAPDFVVGAREGDNSFSDSVVVLDVKTGDYKNHFRLVEKDWHDWDVSNAPILIRTRGGKHLMVATPKDGYLYAFDLADNSALYKVPVTRIEEVAEAFSHGQAVHFCPGAVGGAEWNSPSYVPQTNLVLVGEVEWCDTVRAKNLDELRQVEIGQPWAGVWTWNPFDPFGRFDKTWAGWVYAVDADTGVWKWRLKSNYPIVGGMTPTAGEVVFFGDVGGNFYALDSATGQKLWGQDLGGGIAGGVITYTAGGSQKIAVAAGFSNLAWPTRPGHAKVVVLGLDNAATVQ